MTLPVAYRSEASCLAARSEAIAAGSGLGYDRVIAECRVQSPSGEQRTSVRQAPVA